MRKRPSGPTPGTPEYFADAVNRMRSLIEDGNLRWTERVSPIEAEIQDEVGRRLLDNLAYRIVLRQRARKMSGAAGTG